MATIKRLLPIALVLLAWLLWDLLTIASILAPANSGDCPVGVAGKADLSSGT